MWSRIKLKYDSHELINIYLKWKVICVRDLKLFHTYIYINKLKVPIILQIMEVDNTDTETSCNHEENNSNEETNRTRTHQTIEFSQ